MPNCQILVIDSDENNREAMRDFLTVEGYVAMCAGEAATACRNLSERELPTIALLNPILRPKTDLQFVMMAEFELDLLKIALELLEPATTPEVQEIEPEKVVVIDKPAKVQRKPKDRAVPMWNCPATL